MEREIFVHAAQAGHEVFLECADGSFIRVVAMNVWRHQFEVDALVIHLVF